MTVAPGTATTVRIERGTTIGDHVLFRLKGGDAVIGEGCDLRRGVVISVGGHLVLAGQNLVSWGVLVHCDEDVRIGRLTTLSEYATVVDSVHFHTDPHVPAHRNLRTSPVVIGDNCWVCPKATVTSGVRVGDYCVVASNSSVTTDVPDGQLVGGVPARIVQPTTLPWLTAPARPARPAG